MPYLFSCGKKSKQEHKDDEIVHYLEDGPKSKTLSYFSILEALPKDCFDLVFQFIFNLLDEFWINMHIITKKNTAKITK